MSKAGTVTSVKRLITDIMKVTELESIPAVAILIDFKIAFDAVDWNFLLRALQILTLAHAFKSELELFTPIVPAVLLTMDSHLTFSN